jgi:hypothetical protein
MPDKSIDDAQIMCIARAAGLHKAIDRFPDDIRAAARGAAQARDAFEPPENPTAEPWPPMRTGAGV